MMIPKQCENCILFRFCLDAECLKGKPCAYRKEKGIDTDLASEMRERSGENGQF